MVDGVADLAAVDSVMANGDTRYRSRTYWLVWGCVLLATGLCYQAKIDGSGWVASVIALITAWQARRYGDNKLAAENGK